jgi:hypothetical protein
MMIIHHPTPHLFSTQFINVEHTYALSEKRFQQVIVWLNSYKTFPSYWWLLWRVEFVNPSGDYFQEGIYSNHHGPLLSAAGVITSMEPHYRDLQYLYGSYFGSFRFFRPLRLQFWFKNGTVKCQFDYAIRFKFIAPLLNLFLSVFFKLFLWEIGIRAK